MPTFDLGTIEASQQSTGDAAQVYAISRQILKGYEQAGLTVRFEREAPPQELAARITDRDGTDITATVKLAGSDRRTTLTIALRGKIFVGGLKGSLASESKVQSVAKDKLVEEVRKALKGAGLQAALRAIGDRERVYAYHAVREAQSRGYA